MFYVQRRQRPKDRPQFQPPLFQWSAVGRVNHVWQLFKREGGDFALDQTDKGACRRATFQFSSQKINAMRCQASGQDAVEGRGVAALLDEAEHRLTHVEQGV